MHSLQRAAAQAPAWNIRCLGVLVLAGLALVSEAQVGINADGASPEPAAVLDVDASGLPANGKKGFLMPSVALNSSTWAGLPGFQLPTGILPGAPFNGHGIPNMQPSLWVYNSFTMPALPSAQNSQYITVPGLYIWDDVGNRWARQMAKVLPLQHHTTTGTVTAIANGSWSSLPGLTTVALNLRAGDRVLYSAHGTFRLAEPNPGTISYGYANAMARIRLNNVTTLKQTAASLNGEITHIFSSNCVIFNIFCTSYTGDYSTFLKLQNWRLLGHYDVPSDGFYTFAVEVGAVDGTANVMSGGTLMDNPDLRGTFSVEVVRP